MTGGAGNDSFRFASRADTRNASFAGSDTSGANVDRIVNFAGNGAAAGDMITFGTGANAFGTGLTFIGATVVDIVAVSTVAVDFASLATGTENELANISLAPVASTAVTAQIYRVTVGLGSLTGSWLILNDDVAAITTSDTFINITGSTGTLNAQDFSFA
jgi:hypothetical protein